MFATKSRWNVIIVVMITMLFISSILFLGIRANTEVEDLFVEMFTREQTSQAQQISTGITTFLNEKVTMLEIISRNHNSIPDDNFNTIFSIVYNESEGFYAIEYINSTGIIVSGYPEENVPFGYDLYENKKSMVINNIEKYYK